MRTRRGTTVSVMIALVAGAAAMTQAIPPETVFLESTGFESLSPLQKTPAGWHATEIEHTGKYVDFIWDSTTSYGGRMSVSIRIAEDHPDEVIAYNWHTTMMNWKPGIPYELSCMVKGAGLRETPWVCVQGWDESMSQMLYFATTQKDHKITGLFDWRRIGTVFTIPEATHRVIIRAGIAAPGDNGGQVWFDELQIQEIEPTDQ
jgi:hypothetical protein